MSEDVGFKGENLALTDLETALSILRLIRDASTSTTAEKLSAIKEIARLTGGDQDASTGPGGMTRSELQAELARVRALLDAQAKPS